jgi:hypothetical protein
LYAGVLADEVEDLATGGFLKRIGWGLALEPMWLRKLSEGCGLTIEGKKQMGYFDTKRKQKKLVFYSFFFSLTSL